MWVLRFTDNLVVGAGVETDVEIFGSGVMTEDDGSGYTFDEEEEGGVLTTSSSNGNGSSSQNGNGAPQGIRIYLSAIKEWMIEFGDCMISMSIRTDGAWYRLGKPSSQYKPWYSPVLRTARLAIKVINMLKQQQRIARLSFADIVKRLIEQLKEDPKFNFIKAADVERYLVVHGQIILQQFAEYPEEQIRRSAFVTGLMSKMEEKHHVKLLVGKKTMIKKGRNLNPRAQLQPDAKKSKPMRATTTALVNRIWSSYYTKYNLVEDVAAEVKDDPVVAKEEKAEEDEEDEEEEDDPTPLAPKPYEKKTQQIRLTQVAKKAKADMSEVAVGDAVVVNLDEYIHDSEQLPSMLLVEFLYKLKDGTPMLHGRGLVAAEETVLGNAGDDREVFLTSNCADVEVSGVQKVVVVMKRRPEGYTDRKANALKDEADRGRAKERQGLPKEFFCRAVYSPDKGAFLSLPAEGLALGNGSCKACILRNEEEKLKANKILDGGGFRLEGVEYKIGDYLYLDPTVFQCLENKDEPDAEVIFKGGRNKGLRPFAICQLLSVQKTAKNILSTRMNVQRFYRPDDFGTHRGYTADVHEVSFTWLMLLIATISLLVFILKTSSFFNENHEGVG
jgi:DNA (cytosine-5)-methyltransferase 1